MKYTLAFMLLLTSCAAHKQVIDCPECNDPEYKRLSALPIDSMSQREFEYFKLKDQQCKDARAALKAENSSARVVLEIVGSIIVFVLMAYFIYHDTHVPVF